MPTNTLTDNQCRLVKAADKAQKLFDGHGLHLFVSTKGAKCWRRPKTEPLMKGVPTQN